MKVKISGYIDLDESLFPLADEKELDWFKTCVMKDLILHSNEIGDSVGFFHLEKLGFEAL